MHFSTISLSLLLLSSSAFSAHEKRTSRSSTHARHRRLANKPVAAEVDAVPGGQQQSPAADIHGRQLPGTIKMRKRKDGSNCKARTTVVTSTALTGAQTTISQATATQPSSGQIVATSSADAAAAATTALPVLEAVGSLGSSIINEVLPTNSIVTAVSSIVAVPTTSSSVHVSAGASSAPASSGFVTSSAAAATTTGSSTGSTSSYTPNGKKAGIAGGDSYEWMQDHIGWWYDWSANPSKSGTPLAVPMLWGGGTADSTDASRLAVFKKITTPPKFILGYEEPDCAAGSGSAGLDVSTGVSLWNSLVAPLGAEGSILLSPSMCKQAAESGWLGPFQKQISRDWDITNIHINKNDMAGVKLDIDHYWNTYGKPIWVSEFACVNDVNGFVPCTDQTEINDYISQIVDLFESDDRIYAYAYSDGYGLGDVWPTVKNGALSASGQAYLSAISKY